MTSGGQLERLIRQGQILALKPDLFIRAELVLRYLLGYLVERRFRLLPPLRCYFRAFLHSGDHSLLAPAVV